MRPYLAYLKMTLRLTLRDRQVLFFNFLFPAVFFFIFAQAFRAGQSQGAITQVLTMVLVINVLGSGFFGGGLRATMEREANILRRFKVTPIGPGPILVASLVVGWLMFLPSAALFFLLAKFRYGFVFPENLFSIFLILSVGMLAFRGAGLIVASIANSMAESQIIVQALYMPMLFLSGATFPLSILPEWVQAIAQFLPATHLFLGMQGIMLRGESIAQNGVAVGALLGIAVIAFFISMKLFRWEKEERIEGRNKLWILIVILPFIAIGAWQVKSKGNISKAKILNREMSRSRARLIRGARIFTGDGGVIENGAVHIRNGRIVAVYSGAAPDPELLRADPIEASGKTVLPGFIDTRVAFAGPANRALAAYLYAGVTAVASPPDPSGVLASTRQRFESGEYLGAELVFSSTVSPAPSLSAAEASAALVSGNGAPLQRTLVQQIGPPEALAAARALLSARPSQPGAGATLVHAASAELLDAFKSGAPLSIGTASGAPLLLHGPAIHRELQLWVQAGIPAAYALKAATGNAASLLKIGARAGFIKTGHEASLVIVEGNPLEDISVTERIFLVLFKGERVDRSELFDDFKRKD